MTYLNNDLQVRRELTERIIKLQKALDTEKQNSEKLVNAVTEYAAKEAGTMQKYMSLVDDVSIVAHKIPKEHRQQLLKILPDL